MNEVVKEIEATIEEVEAGQKLWKLVDENRELLGFEKDGEDSRISIAHHVIEAVIVDKIRSQKVLKPLNLGEVVVSITAEGFDTMHFVFAKQLSREKRAKRQDFLGMTEKEEAERLDEVRRKTLASLLKREPLNVPGWKDFQADDRSLEERFLSYFEAEEFDTFIEQLDTLYLGKLLPREYFANLSA